LEQLFALQSDTSKVISKKIIITDLFDQSRILETKIKTPLEVVNAVDNFDGYAWKWRVVIESVESPVYRSLEEFVAIGEDGVYGGVSIPMAIDFSLTSYTNSIEITTTSNQSSPIRREIIVKNDIV
jgi:hypothetical protein